MAAWRRSPRSGSVPSISIGDRIATHVPKEPTPPARAARASAVPAGAGSHAAAVVRALRPIRRDGVASTGPRPLARRVRRSAAAIGTVVAMTLGATGAMPAAALVVSPGTIPGDTFEQDGNFTPDTAGNIDWTSSTVDATVVEDTLIPSGGKLWDSAFQGSSKEEDPGDWVCQAHEGGVTPGKDNLLRAYVSTRFQAATAYLDLGLVKAQGEGDTHVNVEFNRNGQIVPESLNGPCGITRSDGDFLVAYDFGGTSDLTAEVRLFTWDAANSEWDEVAGNLFQATAANNTGAIADDPMVAGTQPLEPRTFAEATIRLPANFLSCPGFGTTNIRSRSSHSIISALQDKMPATGVDLSTCGSVELQKLDDTGAPLAGAVFGLFSSAAATGTPIATCTSNASGTCTISQVTPGSYWVKEIAAPAGYSPDPDIVAVTVAFRTKTMISLPFEDPLILGNLLIRKTHALGGAVSGVRFFLLQNGQAALKRDGSSAECTTGASGTCTISGLVPGTYTVREDASTVPATMTAAADQTVTIVGNQTAEVAFVNPVKPIAIDLVKTVDDKKSVTVHQGDTYTYKLAITNTGQLPLTITSLADVANGTPVALPAGCTNLLSTTLAVGATTSCTYTGTGSVDTTNTATVVGRDSFGRTATDTDNAAVDVLNPAIALTKTVNDAEAVTLHEGDATTYVITFENTGDTPLTITSLADVANGAELTLPAGCAALVNTTPLAPGGKRSCTYSSTAPAGGVSNTATVTGVDALNGPKGTVTANDTAVVSVIDPSISIVKTVNGGESDTVHAGDDLVYVLTFTNNGNTPLTITSLADIANGNNVDLPDTCDRLVNTTPLAPAASRSCTYTVAAGTADVTNTARVAGVDALGKSVNASDSATVDVIKPLISIVKKVNGQDSVTAHEGDPVTYSLAVTNTGDTPLTITALTDVAGTRPVTLSAECLGLVGDSLAPAQTVSCAYPGVAPADDLTNTATVVGEDDLGGDKGTVRSTDSAVVDVIHPAIALTKTVNGAAAVTVHEGDLLTYNVTFTNTGDTPLEVTSFGDLANGGAVDLPPACDGFVTVTLQPTESRTCTYTATATALDVHNVATVAAEDAIGGQKGTVTATDAADVTVISPAIAIVKTVNGDDTGVTVHAGDPLTYTLEITNTGDTPLTITALTDLANGKNLALPADCTDLIGTTLAVGASVTCSYSTAATEDVDNVATVVGEDSLDKSVADDDDASVDVLNPAITIVKTVNGADSVKVHAGDELTYKLVITNSGDAPLTLTGLGDVANDAEVALPEECSDLVGTALTVGASVECTYTAIATTADVTNVATTTGEDELGEEVEDDDDATVDVLNPAIEIVKTANPTAIQGTSGTATFTYVVTNTGDTPLLDVVVTDDILGEIGRIDRLDVGASQTLTKTAPVSQAAPVNVGTATGEDELGKTVTDDDDASLTFVADVVLERPAPPAPAPAPPPAPAPAPAELPRTGGELGLQVAVGLALLFLGGLALIPARRRLEIGSE